MVDARSWCRHFNPTITTGTSCSRRRINRKIRITNYYCGGTYLKYLHAVNFFADTVESLSFFADTVETFTDGHACRAAPCRECARVKPGHDLTRCTHSV